MKTQKEFGTIHFVGTVTTLEPFTVSIAKSGELPSMNGLTYIPSSSLNGALRKCALDYIINSIKNDAGKSPFTIETYYSLAQGYIVDNEIKKVIDSTPTSTHTHKDDNIREANPMLSLFGRWKMGGKLGIGSAYTTRQDQASSVNQGYRSAIFERNSSLLASLPENEVQRYHDIMAAQSIASVDVKELKTKRTQLIKEKSKETDSAQKAILTAEINKVDDNRNKQNSSTRFCYFLLDFASKMETRLTEPN